MISAFGDPNRQENKKYMKTPAERYSEAMDRITKGLEKNTIEITDVEECIDAVFAHIEDQDKEIKKLQRLVKKVSSKKSPVKIKAKRKG